MTTWTQFFQDLLENLKEDVPPKVQESEIQYKERVRNYFKIQKQQFQKKTKRKRTKKRPSLTKSNIPKINAKAKLIYREKDQEDLDEINEFNHTIKLTKKTKSKKKHKNISSLKVTNYDQYLTFV